MSIATNPKISTPRSSEWDVGKYRLVVVTTQNVAEAEKIARKLVEKELAACVNIVPKIRSLYRWKGEIHEDQESLMLIKTSRKLLPELKKRIKKMHSYDLPEFIVFKIEQGDRDYLKWLESQLKKV